MRARLLGVASLFLFAACADSTPPPLVGAPAPRFSGQTTTGQAFDLAARQGKWTVLYFYPKDGTPGCTRQACAFRDAVSAITKLGAEVYGISRDSLERHQKFAEEHKLAFALIADEDGAITKAYGVSGMFGWAKRWTFIIGPTLEVKDVRKDVDPALDASQVAEALAELQQAQQPASPQ